MSIQNIEGIRRRIQNNKGVAKHIPGFVCIGAGNTNNSISSHYAIDKHNLYAYSYSNDVSDKFGAGYNGDDSTRNYYITEDFYNTYIEPETSMTKTLQEEYIDRAPKYMELMGLRIGSKVKVTHKVESKTNGWPNFWIGIMDERVGIESTILNIHKDGDVQLTGNCWFPYFALLPSIPTIKVPDNFPLDSRDYEVKFNEDASISVGCQRISYESLEQIYKDATSVKEQLKLLQWLG